MGQSGIANSIVSGMLSWLKGFANWVLKLFNLAGSSGVSPLKWISDNWLVLLIILLVGGLIMDWFIWMIRWRPYWVWLRKKRVVVDDDDFFLGDDLHSAEFLYDKPFSGNHKTAKAKRKPAALPRKPDTIVRKEPLPQPEKAEPTPKRGPKKQTSRHSNIKTNGKHPARKPSQKPAPAARPSQRRPVRKRPQERYAEERVERPDIFEDDRFRLKTGSETDAIHEDAVFNVSNLPGDRSGKRRLVPKKRGEDLNDDLFNVG